jgi:hypothetical protein
VEIAELIGQLEQEKGKLTCMRLVRLADKPWLKVLFADLL